MRHVGIIKSALILLMHGANTKTDSVTYLGILNFIEHPYLTQTYNNTREHTVYFILYAFRNERKVTDP